MQKLKLRAEDTEDIIILSAYLQDAITMMADIVYQPKARRFVIMLNRYVWENCCPESGEIVADPQPDGEKSCCRIRTGLHFDDVLKITSQNISPSSTDYPLELLSIEARRLENGLFHIDFIFSGKDIIRLECEMISAHMQDIGDPWPAKCQPKHEILEALKDEIS